MTDRIDIYTAEAVGLLKEMVAIPSPSFDESAVCSHICGWMDERDIVHQRIGNNIIAGNLENADGRPTLMLCAHIDTVSPSEGYSFDPYRPEYETAAEVIGRLTERDCGPDDIVAGLGSNDDGASEGAVRGLRVSQCDGDGSGAGGLFLQGICTRSANHAGD